MDLHILQRHFSQIGATLKVELLPKYRSSSFRWAHHLAQLRHRPRDLSAEYLLDIQENRRQECFQLSIREDLVDSLHFSAVDIQPTQQHLLLLLKQPQQEKVKFLCGHDERHWFIATVPDPKPVASVYQAMEALKPPAALQAQRRQGVKRKNWHKRRNAGFRRQGEWFFIPRPRFTPDILFGVLNWEPISRGGGKPHWVEQVYRTGGETVYVNYRHPNGITETAYDALLKRNPKAKKWNWQVMRRNPQVYARGKVKHPDHATIVLPFWHQVLMNGESRLPNVVFLD